MTTNLLPALGLCALLTGCREAAPPADRSAGVSDASLVALAGGRNLKESSGVAMSRDQPGLIYTIDDSGNRPTLFAFDTTGADRGTWVIANATNRDWEAIATAPCGAENCVYIATWATIVAWQSSIGSIASSSQRRRTIPCAPSFCCSRIPTARTTSKRCSSHRAPTSISSRSVR